MLLYVELNSCLLTIIRVRRKRKLRIKLGSNYFYLNLIFNYNLYKITTFARFTKRGKNEKKSTQTTASCAFFIPLNEQVTFNSTVPGHCYPTFTLFGLSYIQFNLLRGNKTLLPGLFSLVHVLFVTWCPTQQPRRSATSQSWCFTANPSISSC